MAAAPSNVATTIRLMAGHELVTEGFAPGQVGSSAMPHKMNTRSCERVNGLQVVLRGYASMAAELAGAQWNEGDVFCSVVRRVALPDAFFAIDGQTETFLTVLDEFGAYPAVIQRELDRYLPFLATTRILIAAVRAGVGMAAGGGSQKLQGDVAPPFALKHGGALQGDGNRAGSGHGAGWSRSVGRALSPQCRPSSYACGRATVAGAGGEGWIRGPVRSGRRARCPRPSRHWSARRGSCRA